ncbi:FAD-dependent oxidoreductase [Candidatus Bathyarchaeota archaeon]|nr:FAD-dependent oxidoreductase [Candidatus Bathyarchaeota archaeon]
MTSKCRARFFASREIIDPRSCWFMSPISTEAFLYGCMVRIPRCVEYMRKEHQFDRWTKVEIDGYHREPARDIPVIDAGDVLVVGGSQTGVTAAMAAARHGARVQLVERFGFLGGQSIFGSVVQWEKRAFINNLGAVLTKGIPLEILQDVVEKGGSDGLWNEPPGCPDMRDGEEWLDPNAIKVTLFEKCEAENIKILLHTLAVDAIVDDEGSIPKVKGVIFENKSGRFAMKARKIIDATADLDIIWRAIGEKGCTSRPPVERISSGFYTWYAGIDNEAFIKWYLEQATVGVGYPDPVAFPAKVRKHLSEGKLIKIGRQNLEEILEKADEAGFLDPIFKMLERHNAGFNLQLGMKWVGHDRWCLSFMSLPCNTADAWDVTRVEILRQLISWHALPVLHMIPGWENAYISRENIHIGNRECRALDAMKIIDQEYIWDLANVTNPTPLDAVGRSGAHDPGKNFLRAGYPVPYGILVPRLLDGVIACARSVGTKHDRALGAHRGIVPSMVTGQAAGTAAALAIRERVRFRELDVSLLQETLKGDGVQIDHESITFDFPLPGDKIKKKP